jgi:hypothetical protein
MADLRQRQDRGIAALPGQTVLAADDQHVLCYAGLDQMVRQHGHGETGGAADLHGMRIGWPDPEMFSEHRGEHDVRRDRAVAAEHAVDLGAADAGIGNRKLGGLAHQVERRRALMLAECREADAGDKAHGLHLTPARCPAPLA